MNINKLDDGLLINDGLLVTNLYSDEFPPQTTVSEGN